MVKTKINLGFYTNFRFICNSLNKSMASARFSQSYDLINVTVLPSNLVYFNANLHCYMTPIKDLLKLSLVVTDLDVYQF